MTLPKELEHDLETLSEHWPQTEMRIRARLLSQDAEIVQLARKNNLLLIAANDHQDRADLAESRLAAADALLREVRGRVFATGIDHRVLGVDVVANEKIDAHLQGAGDE